MSSHVSSGNLFEGDFLTICYSRMGAKSRGLFVGEGSSRIYDIFTANSSCF